MVTERELKGLQIAALSRIHKNGNGWLVPSQSDNRAYTVILSGGEPACTCPDFEKRNLRCKHIFAVEYVIQRETDADGTETYSKSVKVTYTQEWASYNQAQRDEKPQFMRLLNDLCQTIPQPPQTKGRPRLPLSEMVFASGLKVYSTVSGRRFMGDLETAHDKGYVSRIPHYNSVFNYLEQPELAPILKGLVEQAALPLRAMENEFAVDASGFATSTYARWFDEKYGKEHSDRIWLKAHIMVGVKTNVVTSVEVTEGHHHDSPYLPQLVNESAKRFDVWSVSADKGYISQRNLQAITDIGAMPYIMFKDNTTGKGPALWQQMYHYFMLNQREFLNRYHKRSNVETTFSMIKSKFGASVRSRSYEAQVNEILLKVLCHNICVLIGAMYELGINPTFCAESEVAQKGCEN